MTTAGIIWRLWAGLALGIFFYAGLNLTVRHLPGARHPALLTVTSFWVRTLLVLAGFLFMIQEHWEYALAALAGFTVGRAAVLKLSARRQTR